MTIYDVFFFLFSLAYLPYLAIKARRTAVSPRDSENCPEFLRK